LGKLHKKIRGRGRHRRQAGGGTKEIDTAEETQEYGRQQRRGETKPDSRREAKELKELKELGCIGGTKGC
jgi:hypothetical protein